MATYCGQTWSQEKAWSLIVIWSYSKTHVGNEWCGCSHVTCLATHQPIWTRTNSVVWKETETAENVYIFCLLHTSTEFFSLLTGSVQSASCWCSLDYWDTKLINNIFVPLIIVSTKSCVAMLHCLNAKLSLNLSFSAFTTSVAPAYLISVFVFLIFIFTDGGVAVSDTFYHFLSRMSSRTVPGFEPLAKQRLCPIPYGNSD